MQQAELRNQRNNNNRGGRNSGRGGYNNSNSNFNYLILINFFIIFPERGGFRKSYQTKDHQ